MPRIKISPESMTKAASGIDRMINRIPRRTQQSIRSLFFLLVFAGAVGAFVWGAMKGRESAEIKSAPLINGTNDVFDIDVKREREGGNFSAMLDRDVINEMKSIDVEKMRFPSRTNLEPEVERGIVEPDFGRKAMESAPPREPEPLMEGEYRDRSGPAADVRPVERKGPAPLTEPESLLEGEKSRLERLPAPESGTRPADTFRRDTDVRQLEKKKPAGGADIRDAGPIDREGGIIGE